MQGHGLAEKDIVLPLVFLRGRKVVEGRLPARQRSVRPVQPEEAQPAADLGLPALGIDRQRSFKLLRGGFEFLLTLQAQRQIVVRGGILRLLLHCLGVVAFRCVPVLLLKAKMAQTVVNFGCILAASVLGVIQRAFELLHRVVQLSGGRQLDGRSQTARKSRPLRLRRNRSCIAPQKALDEIVVYEENLLTFVCRNVLRHVGVSYLNDFYFDSGVTTKSPCKTDCSAPSPYRPAPPDESRASVHCSTRWPCTQVVKRFPTASKRIL